MPVPVSLTIAATHMEMRRSQCVSSGSSAVRHSFHANSIANFPSGTAKEYPGPHVSAVLNRLKWKGDVVDLHQCTLFLGKPELLPALLRLGIPAGLIEEIFNAVAADLALQLGVS